jgi:hypothetical protein
MAYMGFCSLVLAARLIGNPHGEEQIGVGADAGVGDQTLDDDGVDPR